MTDDILRMRGITKTFPGVKALQDVNLSVRRGEIHAICGENGAGKSTLMKVLSGVYPHGTYDGRDHLRRRAVRVRRHPRQRAPRHRHHPPGAGAVPAAVDRREHLPRQRAGHPRPDRLEPHQPRGRPSCWTGSGLRENPVTPVHRHRRRQAAARGDRQGAVQGGAAAHPRRADRGAQRRGLRAPARPAARPARRGHHLRDHLAQAERDRGDRRLDHDPARRPHDRDASTCADDDVTEDRIISGMVGRDLEHRFPPHEPHIGEEVLRIEDWTVHSPTQHGRVVVAGANLIAAPRRDRRAGRADGRRAAPSWR